MKLLINLFSVSGISWMLTGMLRRYAVKNNLFDVPNPRSSHVAPIPRGGGMAIVVTFLFGLIILYINRKLDITVLIALFGAGLIVALIGFLDDHGHVSPVWRLLAHFFAIAWGLVWLGRLPVFTAFGYAIHPGWLGYMLVVLALVWLLNLFNFMDGIDGIAASEAIFVLGSSFMLTPLGMYTDHQLVAVILIGATTGFLIWNWPPAKIFMGDVGSGFLGATLGIYIYWAIIDDIISFWSWLILLGVFVVDATFTLLRRILLRQKWYEAHRLHAYQNAAIKWGHLYVTLAICLINLFWLLPIAYVSNLYRGWGPILAVLALSPLLVLVFVLKAGEGVK
jgi:Fuc2NAc and GlcNAc transferase